MVAVFLRPADQDPTVTVEPGVGRFDDPPSGRPARNAELVGGLLAVRLDVRGELVLGDGVVAFAVVVGLVEAEALGRLGSRLRSLDWDRVERRLQELVVVAVGAVVRQPDRDPAALAENRTFRLFFALSVGFGPVFGPPSGALVIAPSAASHDQSIPTSLSYSHNPCRQISANTPPAPTPETAGAPNSTNRSRLRSTRSTASPYPERAGSRPSPRGPPPATDASRADETAAREEAARSAPTTSPASANHHPH